MSTTRSSERVEQKNLAEFDKIVKSYPLDWVMVTGTFSKENPRRYYSARVFFKNDEHEYVDSPVDLSAEYIVDNFALYLHRDDFDFYHTAFPELVTDNLVKEKTARDKIRSNDIKAAFVSKMEAIIPMKSISKVVLSGSCYQTYPCQHDVSFYTKSNSKNPALTQLFSSHDIASHYADFLKLSDFMHIRDNMDEETKERLTSKKLTSIHTEHLEFVKIHSSTYYTIGTESFIPHEEIRGVSISFTNSNKGKYLAIKEPGEIARFFGKYLDPVSLNKISDHITSDILSAWIKRIDEMKKNASSQTLQHITPEKSEQNNIHSHKYSSVFFNSNSAKKPDLDVDVADNEMAKSAFGQRHTTKHLAHRR